MSTGDRTILGRISKRGNRYLRTMIMQGARVILLRPANWVLAVNILGFAYLGARLIVRWVWAGFRSAPAADRSRDDHARDRGHRK
jgi:transposase